MKPLLIALLLISFASSRELQQKEALKFYPPYVFQETSKGSEQVIQDVEILIGDVPEGTNLLISSPESPEMPHVFVSKTKKTGILAKDSDYSLVSQDDQALVIPNIEPNKTLYATIYSDCGSSSCTSTVHFDLNFRTQTKDTEPPNEAQQKVSNSNYNITSLVWDIEISPDTDEKKLSHIILETFCINMDDKADELAFSQNCQLFVGPKGDKLPFKAIPQLHTFDILFHQKVYSLKKSEVPDLLCPGCIITVHIKLLEKSYFNIDVFLTHEDNEIPKSGYIIPTQVIFAGSPLHYHLTLDDDKKNQDISIILSPDMSNDDINSMKVTIRCDSPTSQANENVFQFKPHGFFEQFTITQEEHSHCKTAKYFVDVQSESDVVFSFFMETKDSQPRKSLHEGIISGDLAKDETIEFVFFTNIGRTDLITITLQNYEKYDFKIEKCKGIEGCESGNQLEGTPYNFTTEFDPKVEYGMIKNGSSTDVILDPQGEGQCWPIYTTSRYFNGRLNRCFYKLTISNKMDKPTFYEIEVEYKGHDVLLGQQNQNGQTLFGQMSRYYVVPIDLENTESVEFQFLTIQGRIQFYADFVEKYPTMDTHRFEFQNGVLKLQGKEIQRDKIYIGVHGEGVSAIYDVNVHFIYKNGEEGDNAVLLMPGKPRKGVKNLEFEDLPDFYKFHLNLEQNWQGFIEIGLDTFSPGIVMYLANMITDQPRKLHQLESNDGIIRLESNHTTFKHNGTYYVYVMTDEDHPERASKLRIEYILSYTIHTKHDDGPIDKNYMNKDPMFLFASFPKQGIISPNETKYFFFVIPSAANTITLNIKSDSQAIQSYLSLNQDNKTPDKRNYDYVSQKGVVPTFHVNVNHNETSCVVGEVEFCSGYMTMHSNSMDKNVSYTINLQYDTNQQMQLYEGVELFIPNPDVQVPIHLFYYPHPDFPAIIEINGRGYLIDVYVNQITRTADTKLKDPEIKYPSSDRYQAFHNSSEESSPGFHHVIVPPNENLQTETIIALTLNIQVSNGSLQTMGLASVISVLASSTITKIHLGEFIQGKVANQSYRYYSYHHHSNQEFQISLVALTGNPDIYIAYGKAERPTIDNSLLGSKSELMSEVIYISQETIYPRKELKGHWIIGIYGAHAQANEYQLKVLADDKTPNQLMLGEQIQNELDEKEFAMYTFSNLPDTKAFKVNLKVVAGKVKVKIYGKSYETAAQNLVIQKDVDVDFQNDIKIRDEDDKVQVYPYYEIQVNNLKKYSKFFLSIERINTPNMVQLGLNYQYILGKMKRREYAFLGDKNKTYEIQINAMRPGLIVYASHNERIFDRNYIWKKDLTRDEKGDDLSNINSVLVLDPETYAKSNDKGYWDQDKLIPSQPNIFYILFENRENEKGVEISFVVTEKDTGIMMLGDGNVYFKDLKIEEEVKYMYMTTDHESILSLNVEYLTQSIEESELRKLKQDYLLDIQFEAHHKSINDKSSTRGTPIDPYVHAEIQLFDYDKKIYYIRQQAEVTVSTGTVFFTIKKRASTAELNRDKYRIYITSTGYDYVPVEPTDWKTETLRQEPKVFEITYPKASGTIFQEAIICHGEVSTSFEDALGKKHLKYLTETRPTFTSKRLSKGGERTSIVVQNRNRGGALSHINVHSTFFPNQHVEFRPDLVLEGQIFQFQLYEQEGQEASKYKVTIRASAVEIGGQKENALEEIKVVYNIFVCQDKESFQERKCEYQAVDNRCFGVTEVRGPLENADISKTFEGYSTETPKRAMVVAQVLYQGKPIKTVPYPEHIFQKGTDLEWTLEEWYKKNVIAILLTLLVIGILIAGLCILLQKHKDEETRIRGNIEMKRVTGMEMDDDNKLEIE